MAVSAALVLAPQGTPAPSEQQNCPTCGEQPRIIRIEPDQRYINLDIVTHACSCGEDAGCYVARKE